MGRTAGSKLHDMRTWGDKAVICDPWANETFNVSVLLSTPRKQRPHMFSYIESGLESAAFATVEYSFAAGSGHSIHWRQKYQNRLITDEQPFDHSCKVNM